MSIFVAILVFGLIILIHEFGHFIVAKKCGIGVIEFSIGMGPRLFSLVRGETRYSLKLLPFGGSCMMLGEDENEADPKAFNNKSVWARMAVIAAGPIFNFVLAFVLGMIIVGYAGYDSPEITGIMDGYPAQTQGLQPGDVITKVNGKKIILYRDLQMIQLYQPGKTMEIVYERGTEGTGAVEEKTATIVPMYSEEYSTYMMGIEVSGYRTPITSMGELLKYSVNEVRFCMENSIKSVGMLVKGQVGRNDIAGPVRMVSIIGETVEASSAYGMAALLLSLCNLSLLLSATLGVMNLLPIPALDGGRLVFLILEALRGKPIDKEKEGMVHMAGMVFLMGLMVVVLFNDVITLFFS